MWTYLFGVRISLTDTEIGSSKLIKFKISRSLRESYKFFALGIHQHQMAIGPE